MEDTIIELKHLIDEFAVKFNQIPDNSFSAKPSPLKWSKKEVVGHLVDSAHNNLRRFITGQYEVTPPKITYDQNFWVEANGYQAMSNGDVITIWKLINHRICDVLTNMAQANYTKTCDTGKDNIQVRSLQWLAEDYVRHMKHHINQVIAGSFDIVYQ